MSNKLLDALLESTNTYLTPNLKVEAYLEACEQIKWVIGEMTNDYFRYARSIDNCRSQLEEGCFYLRGHDEALLELIKTIPFSIKLATSIFGSDDPSKVLISALVESFCNQSVDLFDIKSDEFINLIHKLAQIGMEKECLMVVNHLIDNNQGRHDELLGLIISGLATTAAFKMADYDLIVEWLQQYGKDLLAYPWGNEITKDMSLRMAIAVYRHGMTDIGEASMRANARSAKSAELITREKLIGQPVSLDEIREFFPNDVALVAYAYWTDNQKFDTAWLRRIKLNPKCFTDAFSLAEKHQAVAQGRFDELAGIAMMNTDSPSTFFMVLDDLDEVKKISGNVIQHEIMVMTDRYKYSFKDLSRLAEGCDERCISFDPGAMFGETINETFIEAAGHAHNDGLFLKGLTPAVCKMIDKDILVEHATHAAKNLNDRTIETLIKVMCPELIQSIPVLHRAKLSNDMGL